MDIRRGDLTDQRIIALLRYHFDKCHEVTPKCSAHVFSVEQLAAAEIDFWAAWDGETLLGVGAMKPLDDAHGEVKSMHTAETARRRGVGSAISPTSSPPRVTGDFSTSASRRVPSPSSNRRSPSTGPMASPNARRSAATGKIPTASS